MRLRWLAPALADFERIGDYIVRDNPAAAESVMTRIIEAAESLADYPLMGRAGRVIGSRELVVPATPYIIAYRVREGAVEILAVRHGAQRWPTSFD